MVKSEEAWECKLQSNSIDICEEVNSNQLNKASVSSSIPLVSSSQSLFS